MQEKNLTAKYNTNYFIFTQVHKKLRKIKERFEQIFIKRNRIKRGF